MPQTQEIVVDPFLLCLPNPCISAQQLEDFINALVGWRGLAERKDTCVLLSDSARIALNDDGEYPHRFKLSQLLKLHNCDIADENTITKLANGILERIPSLEEYYGLKAVLIDEASLTIKPNFILTRLKDNCRKAFAEDLTSVSTIHQIIPSKNKKSVIVASGLGMEKLCPQPSEIDLMAEVHDIELSSEDVKGSNTFPIKTVYKLPVSFCHDDLLNNLGLWSIWNNASDETSVRLAIEICIKNIITSGASDQSIIEFVIGDHFVDSLRRWGAATRSDYAMVIIESCARISLGIPKNLLNEFREDSKATSKQRTREDGALAFRTHLTKKGIGLRLLFWKYINGTLEFANVGDKDELKIS
jgi:hypothetical protein